MSIKVLQSKKETIELQRFQRFHVILVGPSGLEPPTSRLSVVCSNQLSYRPAISFHRALVQRDELYALAPVIGGDDRDRTDDPLLAKQVLSQLSYTPVFILCFQGRYTL